jgi:nicotinamidase-related amidase
MSIKYEEIVKEKEIGGMNTVNLNALFSSIPNKSEYSKGCLDKKERVLLLAIDMQNDFMDGGALGVPNAKKDVINTTKFIYRNLEKITKIYVSLDTHRPNQIFHPMWWVDKNGCHPEPLTVISNNEVKDGRWRAFDSSLQEESSNYVRELERIGKKKLSIWPYHCLEGTFGAALESQFSNMINYHSIVSKSDVIYVQKGKQKNSEMYGIIKPEVYSKAGVNEDLLEMIGEFDKIIIVGEAKSHCVLESVRQIVEYFANNKEITQNLYVFEDCTSSIPGFEDMTKKEFDILKKNYGINLVKSTDFVF